MEPLFETETKMSFEEYERYQWAVVNNYPARKTVWTVMLIFIALYMAFLVWLGAYRLALIILVALLALNPVRIWMNKRSIRKMYESMKLQHDAVTHLSFFEDHFETDDAIGHATCRFADLYQVIESGTNFYLMISKAQGCCVVKANCSDELIAFLQDLKQKTKEAHRR